MLKSISGKTKFEMPCTYEWGDAACDRHSKVGPQASGMTRVLTAAWPKVWDQKAEFSNVQAISYSLAGCVYQALQQAPVQLAQFTYLHTRFNYRLCLASFNEGKGLIFNEFNRPRSFPRAMRNPKNFSWTSNSEELCEANLSNAIVFLLLHCNFYPLQNSSSK